MKLFEAEINNLLFAERIQKDQTDGIALGVKATPTFFVNGIALQELGYVPLKAAIQAQLKLVK